MAKHRRMTATRLYSMTAFDGRAYDMNTELRCLGVMNSLAEKSPRRYAGLAALATHVFQLRFVDVVPLPRPICLGRKKHARTRWDTVLNSVLLPNLSVIASRKNKLIKAWLAAVRNFRVDVRDLDQVDVPGDAFANAQGEYLDRIDDAVRTSPERGKGGGATYNAIMEVLHSPSMIGDTRGYYGDDPEVIPDDDYHITVERPSSMWKDNVVTYTWTTDSGFGKTTHSEKETYHKTNGHRTDNNPNSPGSTKVAEYMKEHSERRPPKKEANPDAESGLTATEIETTMSLAIFRPQAQQILRNLEIKGGGAVDAPVKRKVTLRQLVAFDAAFHGMIRKALERHMEAQRNKYGYIERKRRITGTVVFKFVGWTDPPNITVNVR